MKRVPLFALWFIIILTSARGEYNVDDGHSKNLLDVIVSGMRASDRQAFLIDTRRRLPSASAALAPILATLPRRADGRLEVASARYALHHYFMRQFSWRVKGLDVAGSHWNSSSLANVSSLQKLPASVRHGISDYLKGSGMSDQDVRALAVAIQKLASDNSEDRLRAVYNLISYPVDVEVNYKFAEYFVDLYTGTQILGMDLAKEDPNKLMRFVRKMSMFYPRWQQFQNFTRDVLAANTKAALGSHVQQPPMAFAQISQVLRTIEERHGSWRSFECLELKSGLMEVEEPGTGRVRLSSFYGKALNGTWQFSETSDYLRQLGCLDESEPSSPRVIIANYINSHSNCISSNGHFSVCCVSECESLYGHIEGKLGTPTASPEELGSIVSSLPSSTVNAPRELSPVMMQRLRAIAAEDGGSIPIYGRLFAQWMHHAYPHECEFPHISGTTSPKALQELTLQEQVQIMTNKSIMELHASRKERRNAPVHGAPWLLQEELPTNLAVATTPVGWMNVQLVVASSAFAVTILSLLHTAARASRRLSARAPPCVKDVKGIDV